MNDTVDKMTPFSDGKKRKMIMTKLTAIALTARGANPGADVTFFKSHKGEAVVDKSGDLVNLMTSIEDGHQHGIAVETYDNQLYINVMYAKGKDADSGHYHVLAPSDSGYLVSTNDGHSHTIDTDLIHAILIAQLNKGDGKDTITKEQADLLTAVNLDGVTENLEDAMSKELEATIAAANKTIEKQTADLAHANVVVSFTPAAKAFYDGLAEAEQKSFVGKTDADRVATMEMAKSADPVVYKSMSDGTEFRKSDGAAMINMAKRVDAQDLEIAKQSAMNKHSVFVKRAADEMGNLTGEDVTKIALLAAIDTIDNEETRKSVGEMIKASNSGAAVALETIGTQTPAEMLKAGDALDTMAKTYAEDNKVSVEHAYVKVLETKAGQELYNEANS